MLYSFLKNLVSMLMGSNALQGWDKALLDVVYALNKWPIYGAFSCTTRVCGSRKTLWKYVIPFTVAHSGSLLGMGYQSLSESSRDDLLELHRISNSQSPWLLCLFPCLCPEPTTVWNTMSSPVFTSDTTHESRETHEVSKFYGKNGSYIEVKHLCRLLKIEY